MYQTPSLEKHISAFRSLLYLSQDIQSRISPPGIAGEM